MADESSVGSPAAAVAVDDTALVSALLALGTMATVTIYYASLGAANEEREEDAEEISSANALWMPISGSAVLLSLYLVFKFLPAEYLLFVLAGLITLMGVFSLARNVHRFLVQTFPKLATISTPFHLSMTKGTEVYLDEEFDWVYLAVLAGASAVGVAYMIWRHWILTNVLGLSLAFHTLRLLQLDQFATGFIVLVGLFLYDIFWVFGTDVMVTVARSFDAPIKIVFPYDIFAANPKLAMLGLGDIVVPGIFIVLALRFDRRHIPTHGTQAYAKPYFTATLLAYVLGLLATFAVLIIFRAAQPALLYLSPACILGVLLPAVFRGEIAQVWNFNTIPKDAADAAKPAAGPAPTTAEQPAEAAADAAANTSASGSTKARARTATKRSTKA